MRLDLSSRLEQFNRIPIGIFQLDLFAARTDLHLVAEVEPGVLQIFNTGREIRHAKHDAVPPTGFLVTAGRHRARTRSPRTAEQNSKRSHRDAGKGGWLLKFQLETQVVRVERNRATEVLDLIANTVEGQAQVVRRSLRAC